jgi:hypothetical protein
MSGDRRSSPGLLIADTHRSTDSKPATQSPLGGEEQQQTDRVGCGLVTLAGEACCTGTTRDIPTFAHYESSDRSFVCHRRNWLIIGSRIRDW